MNLSCLVTGAGGAVGYWLTQKLLDVGYKVTAVDKTDNNNLKYLKHKNLKKIVLDLTDYNQLNELGFSYSKVFHLAAFNGTDNFYRFPFEVLLDSTLPTINLLNYFARSQHEKPHFFYTGSSESYASSVKHGIACIPTSEDVLLSIDDPKNVRWSYGLSKTHGEVACFAAQNQFGINCTVLRLHNIYGPKMGFNHVIPDFTIRALNGKYELYGYDDTRSFLYVKDAVNAIYEISRYKECIGEIYNIGSTNEIKILDLAKLILKKLKIDNDIILHPSPAGSVKRRCPDVIKIKKVIGVFEKYSIDEGLDEFISSLQNG